MDKFSYLSVPNHSTYPLMVKNFTLKTSYLLITTFLLSNSINGQVGINESDPNGVLDISSSSQGVVLPRMSLTSTVLQAPAVNPKDGVTIIPAGTTVYNDNTTANASNNVYPGMYVWDGAKWLAYNSKKQNELYEQSNVGSLRSVNGVNIIAGLDSESFTASYTGDYRVEMRVNYGGGGARTPNQGAAPGQSDGYLNIAQASGTFTLTFNGSTYDVPAHAYSTAYDSSEGATNYFAIWQEYTATFIVALSAGDVVPFSMNFTQNLATTYENDGDSGDGRGYIGYDIPCTVEINYVGD
ncbi:MAG: hypothetical protein K0U54_00870 [Bacteroidetes bacterium]|nr:hypothetical protein [Bacteroidota bacterium]